ncbi:RTA1 domain protein, partial [Ascobolus immersus RN42]
FVFFRYEPSLAAAIVFVILYFITGAYHTYQIIKTKTWYFIPLVVGVIFQFGGHIARCFATQNVNELNPYLVNTLLCIVAPVLYAASIYMILGRLIIRLRAAHHSIIPLRFLTKIFVVGDVISFMIQGGGSGLMSSGDPKNTPLGEKIIVAGLFFQIVLFGFFVIVAWNFHVKINRAPTATSLELEKLPSRQNWRMLLMALYVSSALILIRSLFRAIEFIEGNEGYLMRSEGWLYGFDSALMWIAVVVFNVWHP